MASQKELRISLKKPLDFARVFDRTQNNGCAACNRLESRARIGFYASKAYCRPDACFLVLRLRNAPLWSALRARRSLSWVANTIGPCQPKNARSLRPRPAGNRTPGGSTARGVANHERRLKRWFFGS